MIDWLVPKVAMTLAALLMLAGVVGFFTAQGERAVQEALEAIAVAVAAYVDEVSRSTGELAASLSVGPPPPEAPEGLALPARAAGKPYVLVLHPSHVAVTAGGRRAMAGFDATVHLWLPEARAYSMAGMEAADASHTSLPLGGGWVALTRQRIEVGGERVLGTFVF